MSKAISDFGRLTSRFNPPPPFDGAQGRLSSPGARRIKEGAAAAVSLNPVLEAVACYYCGRDSSQEFVIAQDDLTGKPGHFRFVSCNNCGLVYQNPRIDVEHIKDYYDDEYIAHRKKSDWGMLTWFYNYSMSRHDRQKEKIVRRYLTLNSQSEVLDVGCGAGTFLMRMSDRYGCKVAGVDFKDLSDHAGFENIEFHCGLFYQQRIASQRFDLITMWHFLEHDYDPIQTLSKARSALKNDGYLVIEVPRLDSLTYRLYRERWPGLQAPQHTVLYSKRMLLEMLTKTGLTVVDYLPYGAFPAYFYLFAGAAFKLLDGKGLNLRKAIAPYFIGQLLLCPFLLLEKRINLAMQTVVCRRTK